MIRIARSNQIVKKCYWNVTLKALVEDWIKTNVLCHISKAKDHLNTITQRWRTKFYFYRLDIRSNSRIFKSTIFLVVYYFYKTDFLLRLFVW